MVSDLHISQPFRVIPGFKDRIWGIPNLSHWYPNAPARTIGEAWYTAQESQTDLGRALGLLLLESPELLGNACDPKHPGICPLLVKFLFTSSRLSVQVHPDDDYARMHHASLGKTEAWFVIDAEPGAEVALGFKEEISAERLRSSAVSGEIEKLLDWRPVQAGDMIFVPAGTVHAIGSGLTICEVQQNSDVTYRLYDYGRPRELHLEHGCAVSELGPYFHHFTRKELGAGRILLADSQYFRIEHLAQKDAGFTLSAGLPHYSLLVCVRGEGAIAGHPFSRGDVWFVPAESAAVPVDNRDAEWLLVYGGNNPSPQIDAN